MCRIGSYKTNLKHVSPAERMERILDIVRGGCNGNTSFHQLLDPRQTASHVALITTALKVQVDRRKCDCPNTRLCHLGNQPVRLLLSHRG
ncbi:hypothetical protein D3C74_417360 [compost metagenome]